MAHVDQFVCIGAIIIGVQFLAAIIGPGVLKFITVLSALGAFGLAAYTFILSQNSAYPSDAQEGVYHAAEFAVLGLAVIIAYFILRTLFRALARASAA